MGTYRKNEVNFKRNDKILELVDGDEYMLLQYWAVHLCSYLGDGSFYGNYVIEVYVIWHFFCPKAKLKFIMLC